jgi:cholesterol 24(S)-hydroxylase
MVYNLLNAFFSINNQKIENDNMDIEKMTDDFVTFFIAGQETTANSLAFCFLEIARNPQILSKAREEIDRVLGKRRTVTYQDFTELKYCSAIFKETLRLYPPAALLNRKSDRTFHIDGCEIPKETNIFVCFVLA